MVLMFCDSVDADVLSLIMLICDCDNADVSYFLCSSATFELVCVGQPDPYHS